MMTRKTVLHLFVVVSLPLTLLVTGCDLEGPDDSDFEVFLGDWKVDRVTADGQGQTSSINERYEGAIVVSFIEDGNTGQRNFRLFGNRKDADNLNVFSTLTFNSDRSMDVFLQSGFSDWAGDIRMGYEFLDGDRVLLTVQSPYGRPLLEELLGGQSGFSDPVVEITLQRDE